MITNLKTLTKFSLTVSTFSLILAGSVAQAVDNQDKSGLNRAKSPDVVTQQNTSIWNKSADELTGMDIFNSSSEKNVGEIDSIVSNTGLTKLYAVIAVDQFLDMIGGKKVVIPVDELKLMDDKIEVSATEEQLKKWPEYSEKQYYQLTLKDRPLKDISSTQK